MPTNIVFFGDSVCFGQYVSLHQTWVTRVAQKLSEKHNVTVTNSSISGSTTRQALERMTYDLSKLHMDILLVQYGINDANYWETDKGVPRVSPEAFGANLEEIVTRAVVFGVKKVFFIVSQPSGRSINPLPYARGLTYQQCLDRYNIIIRAVSQKAFPCEVDLIDMDTHFRLITNNNRNKLLELLLPEPDWIHLSPKGHQVFFDYIYPILDNAVRKLERS